MRAILGVASLLIVLAVVGMLAARQLRATGQAVGGAVSSPAGSSVAAPGAVADPSSPLPQRVKADVARALEQGAAATRNAADQ